MESNKNQNKFSTNKKVLYSILIVLIVLISYFVLNQFYLSKNMKYPLRRRNAMTEEEINDILKKLKAQDQKFIDE